MTDPGPRPHDTRLPGTSAAYRAAREELLLAEIELMRRREGVAARRRALPPGPVVQDYTFLEGPASWATGARTSTAASRCGRCGSASCSRRPGGRW